MNKLTHTIAFLASLVLATAASAQTANNWKNGTNELVWKNGTNELCWRDTDWSPTTGTRGCDGVPLPKPAPQRVVVKKPTPVVPQAPVKVNWKVEALFDFDQSALTPENQAKLNELANKNKEVTLEAIIAVGHTDARGTDVYNQKLSRVRAEAVKTYLASKGIDKERIYTEGRGKTKPVADNTTAEGRAKNRRVEIELVGLKK